MQKYRKKHAGLYTSFAVHGMYKEKWSYVRYVLAKEKKYRFEP